jgi:predicted NAD-dependent protein-ADP-ribosyltransferase YbiA (DUF1768 family)
MSDDIERFYRKFAKDKVKFSYDEDGNLVERDKAGTVINTITLSAYRPLTLEEIAEMEKTRMEEIAIASQALDDARVILYTKMQEPDPLPSIILKLNEDILQADLGLQHARFKHKGIEIQESVRICDLDFTQLNEVRKYPDPVSFLRMSPFSIYEKYVRPTDPGKRALVSVAEAKAQSKLLGKQDVILFGLPTTNEYGFLSMRWPIELRHEGTMYKSVAQAVYAEITKHNLNPRAHAKIMTSEDGDVAYSFDDNELYKRPEARGISKKEDYWPQLYANMNCATIAKFIQYPELALRLLQTGDAILGAWETYDNEYIGIGIPIDAPTAKNPTTWTGKNTLGNILMEIRATLKKGKELKLPYASIKEKKIQRQEKAAAKAATQSVAKAATKADAKEIKEEMQVKIVDLSEPSALDGTTLQKWMEDPNHVYIGKKRVVIIDGKKFPKEHSRWVNPYEIIEDGLVDYEKRIRSLVDSNEIPVKDLLALKGKTLGCWENTKTCHGHILNKLIREYSKRYKAAAPTAPVAPAPAPASVAPIAPVVAPVAPVAPVAAPVAPASAAPVAAPAPVAPVTPVAASAVPVAPVAPAPIAQSKSVKSVTFQP